MPKIDRRSPESDHYLILRKLSSGKNLRRKDFEIPRLKTLEFNDEVKSRKIRNEYVSHSSLRLRLDELIKTSSVVQIQTRDKSKKGEPISEFYITFFGIVKMLQLHGDSFDEEIFSNSLRHIPFALSDVIEKLTESKILDKETILHLLVSCAKSFDLLIDYKPNENAGIIGDRLYNFPSTLLLKKWVHVYDVQIKIKQISTTYSFHQTFIASGETRKKSEIKEKTGKIILKINQLFIFCFIHELIMTAFRIPRPKKYPTPDTLHLVIDVIKSNKLTRKIYLENIQNSISVQSEELNVLTMVSKGFKDEKNFK